MTEAEYIERLNNIYTYTRESDGKTFKIRFYGHWTDIVAADGEEDSVKVGWCDSKGETYVSHSKVHKYTRTRNVRSGSETARRNHGQNGSTVNVRQ